MVAEVTVTFTTVIIPSWALYAGGAALLLVAFVIFLKLRKKTRTR